VLGRNPDTVRAPDAAFVRRERVPPTSKPGFFDGAPDLAVEVVSPDDRASEVLAKVQDWLTAGCALVWVADPRSQTLTAYQPGGQAQVYGLADRVPGAPVLPEFTLALAEIFRT
jgi:Uma2 family endonuclease